MLVAVVLLYLFMFVNKKLLLKVIMLDVKKLFKIFFTYITFKNANNLSLLAIVKCYKCYLI